MFYTWPRSDSNVPVIPIATSQVEDEVDDGKDDAAVEFARRGDQKGVKARAENRRQSDGVK